MIVKVEQRSLKKITVFTLEFLDFSLYNFRDLDQKKKISYQIVKWWKATVPWVLYTHWLWSVARVCNMLYNFKPQGAA